MKRAEPRKPESAAAGTRILSDTGGNGHRSADLSEADLGAILAGLQTMRDGDFSVRLPGNWTGVAAKSPIRFNEIVVANQHMAQELKRVGQVVGKEGKTRERIRFYDPRGAWGEMEISVNTLVDDFSVPPPKSRAPSPL